MWLPCATHDEHASLSGGGAVFPAEVHICKQDILVSFIFCKHETIAKCIWICRKLTVTKEPRQVNWRRTVFLAWKQIWCLFCNTAKRHKRTKRRFWHQSYHQADDETVCNFSSLPWKRMFQFALKMVNIVLCQFWSIVWWVLEPLCKSTETFSVVWCSLNTDTFKQKQMHVGLMHWCFCQKTHSLLRWCV